VDARQQEAQRRADEIRGALGARWVGIYTVAGDVVRNDAWSGPAPPAHPVFAADEGLTAVAIRTRATVVSNDVQADPRYLTNQGDSGSELIVPVLLDGEVVGTLDVESDRTGAFDDELVRQCEQSAQSLARLWRR
jgi:GAF domain-containing protein